MLARQPNWGKANTAFPLDPGELYKPVDRVVGTVPGDKIVQGQLRLHAAGKGVRIRSFPGLVLRGSPGEHLRSAAGSAHTYPPASPQGSIYPAERCRKLRRKTRRL